VTNDKKEKRPTLIKALFLGRNDPCICGSGKKYKKCCIDKYGDMYMWKANGRIDGNKD